MGYEKVPDGYSFESEFDTWIIAYCPDTLSWFATNRRFFYFEYELEFATEAEAVDFFKEHYKMFFDIERELGVYRPSFAKTMVILERIVDGRLLYTDFYLDGHIEERFEHEDPRRGRSDDKARTPTEVQLDEVDSVMMGVHREDGTGLHF